MTDPRRVLSFLLLVLVAVVTAGGAFLAVHYSPSQPVTSLKLAVKSTTAATSYTVDLRQTSTSSGSGFQHLVVQAPDRAAGYQQSEGLRSYLVVVNDTVYQTVAKKITTSITARGFKVVHATNPLSDVDQLPEYLALVDRAKAVHRNGSVYTFTLPTTTGTTAYLTYTITGEYVSNVELRIPGSLRATMAVSAVNSSPSVTLPSKSSVLPSSSTTTTPTTAAP